VYNTCNVSNALVNSIIKHIEQFLLEFKVVWIITSEHRTVSMRIHVLFIPSIDCRGEPDKILVRVIAKLDKDCFVRNAAIKGNGHDDDEDEEVLD
jgi:hypothetical protein